MNQPPKPDPESNLVTHARNELRLAGMFDPDADYGPELANHILEIVKLFSTGGHSGGSASITTAILERLLRFQTLTPINTDLDTWMEVGTDMWQSTRDPSYFSNNGGKTWYSLDEKIKTGDHVYHHPSAEYLGVVGQVHKAVLTFYGPRSKEGEPYHIAGFDEVRVGPAPTGGSADA